MPQALTALICIVNALTARRGVVLTTSVPPTQASSGQAAQDRAEASSKPPLQEAGSSEPVLDTKGPGQGKPSQQAEQWQRDVEPAIHSNSAEQVADHRAGSMPGYSSRDEVQVSLWMVLRSLVSLAGLYAHVLQYTSVSGSE